MPLSSSTTTVGMFFTFALNIGISVRAAMSEPIRENVTVKARSLHIWPAMPITNIIGKNTAIVVNVDPAIAPLTSEAPYILASIMGLFSSWRCLYMFSITTIPLSTSMPTPSARPPKDIMFIVVPLKNIRANTTIIETGILSATIRALFIFLKKNNSTRNARKPP